jgi:hypothetical protein
MDNRAAPRYAIELEVELRSRDTDFAFVGITENLSESGLLVRTWRTEPKGTLFDLTFPTFRGAAEVVWTRESDEQEGAGLGMRFVSLSSTGNEELPRLLASAGAVFHET